jgi:alanyl-tRNA synthetase
VTPEEAATLPLRKEPAREGELRVIEIDGFDLTPCGGTHARSTGEVGVITMCSWERAKGLTRIHFMAGVRAVADYRKANRTARVVAALFSAGREDTPALVARLVEENKNARRRIEELEQVACRIEADELIQQACINSPSAGSASDTSATVIATVFEDRSADSLKHLARALIAHPNTIALLGSREVDTARLVFARSTDASGDMNGLMRRACEMIEGRGGGKSDMAQGGGKNVEKLREALDHAAKSLI